MHRYHLPDVLTWSRVVIVIALGAMTALTFLQVVERSPMIAFWLYAIGWATDALDGWTARKWLYPKDGKRRWWRENNFPNKLDKFADINLTIVMVAYLLTSRLSQGDSVVILICGSVAFAIYCILVEMDMRLARLGGGDLPRAVHNRVMLRRYLFIILAVPGLLLYLVWNIAYWPLDAKVSMTIVMGFAMLGVWLFKKDDRGREVDTPLPGE